MRLICGAAIVVALSATGCTPNDVGYYCPVAGSGAEEDPNSPDFPEVIEINTLFQCESLVCLITDDKGGYCSRECVSDTNCPSAFICRTVGEQGPLSSFKFCAWRSCRVDFECGDPTVYECRLRDLGDEGLCALKP